MQPDLIERPLHQRILNAFLRYDSGSVKGASVMALFEVTAPRVQEDHERNGGAGGVMRRGVGLVIDDLLRRAVLGAGDVDRHLERYRFHLLSGGTFGGFGREERHARKQGGDGLHLAEGRRWALI